MISTGDLTDFLDWSRLVIWNVKEESGVDLIQFHLIRFSMGKGLADLSWA